MERRDGERQEQFENARSVAVEVVWMQANAAHLRIADLDPADMRAVSRANRLLAMLPEDDGTLLEDRFTAREQTLMRLYWTQPQPQVVEDYARALFMGAGIYGLADSRAHLSHLCKSDHRSAALRGLMLEFVERHLDPTNIIETFAPSEEDKVAAWLAFDQALPVGHELKALSVRQLDAIAEAIEVQGLSDFMMVGDDFLQDNAAKLVECMSPQSGLKVAKAFYNLPTYEYVSTHQVGLAVLSSPYLANVLGDRAAAGERMAAGGEQLDPQQTFNFRVAHLQHKLPVQDIVEFIDSRHVHSSQRDDLFASAIRRYLKFGMLDEARICLSFVDSPALWANILLDYATFSVQSEAACISDEDIRIYGRQAQAKVPSSNFLTPFIDGNYPLAATHFYDYIRLLAKRDSVSDLEAKAVQTFLSRLVARDPKVGKATYLEGSKLLHRRCGYLYNVFQSVGLAAGYGDAAERWARTLVKSRKYDRYQLHQASALLQHLLLRNRTNK